jgi:hypothetical protein
VELQNIDPQIFKNEYGKLPGVKVVSMSSHILEIGSAVERYIKTSDQLDSIGASSVSVDEAFISDIKSEFLAGRNFSNNKLKNSRLIIVNEEFVKRLNLKEPVVAIDRSS